MDHEQLSTAQDGYAPCRRLAASTLWLAACLVSAGLAWAVPVAAQDSGASSQCANGTVVPEPEDHPGLVADCEVLLALRDRFAGDADLPWSVDTPITGWEPCIAVVENWCRHRGGPLLREVLVDLAQTLHELN